LQGASLEDINLELIQTMKNQAGEYADILETIFQGIMEAIHEADDLKVYTSGALNVLKYPELANSQSAEKLLGTLEDLEDKEEFVKYVEDAVKENEDIQILIGQENTSEDLKDCSLVTATYKLPEGGKGTIGIIGPKRMDYKKVVTMLKDLTVELDDIFNNNG
jgi:heat-inducible transcriptional repressor